MVLNVCPYLDLKVNLIIKHALLQEEIQNNCVRNVDRTDSLRIPQQVQIALKFLRIFRQLSKQNFGIQYKGLAADDENP